jgi:caffeoyl-CoA O-methyltransferase
MDIIAPLLEEYMRRITPRRHEVLVEMEKVAEELEFPIIGPLVGRVLYQYARLLSARRIMELGSGFGYSAFWLAMATAPDAKIVCTESSQENIALGKEFLARAGLQNKVEYFSGDALESIDGIPGEFDLVFMDIDKHQYPDGFRKSWPRLRNGGLFIADNALWYGRIVEKDDSEDTAGIRNYNKMIYATPGAFSIILPVRDGVAVTLKEPTGAPPN